MVTRQDNNVSYAFQSSNGEEIHSGRIVIVLDITNKRGEFISHLHQSNNRGNWWSKRFV